MTETPSEFIYNLLRDLGRRVDDMGHALDEKISSLEERQSESNERILALIKEELKAINEQLDKQGKVLDRHDHFFSIIGFFVTGGVAALVGLWEWVAKAFGHH